MKKIVTFGEFSDALKQYFEGYVGNLYPLSKQYCPVLHEEGYTHAFTALSKGDDIEFVTVTDSLAASEILTKLFPEINYPVLVWIFVSKLQETDRNSPILIHLEKIEL